MNIQAEKLEIMKLILETENPLILKSIKKIFAKSSPVDFWTTLPQEQKNEIMLAIKEIENGDIVDYEDIIKNHR